MVMHENDTTRQCTDDEEDYCDGGTRRRGGQGDDDQDDGYDVENLWHAKSCDDLEVGCSVVSLHEETTHQ